MAGFFVNGWWNAKQDQQDVMTIFEQSKSDAQRVPMFPATVMAAPGHVDPLSGRPKVFERLLEILNDFADWLGLRAHTLSLGSYPRVR